MERRKKKPDKIKLHHECHYKMEDEIDCDWTNPSRG